MNLNDWEFIWKRQPLPIGGGADIEKLKQTFEASHRRMARAFLVRDVTECAAGLFVSAVFGFVGWNMGRQGWPFVIVVGLCLGVTGFFIRERFRARGRLIDPAATVVAKLESDLEELRHQRRLLSNIVSWYIAPIFVACLIVMATITAHSPLGSLQRAPWFMAGMLLFMVGVNVGVWALNRLAVKRQLDPRIAELEKLRDEFLRQG